ncbi:MAG: LUD domain-containing protein, partial [Acidiferrobacterales bacterium]
SGRESPTTLNFLPDVHIVVLRREQIVAHIEDVWSQLRSELAAMPRTINFITGPSRTADVEQTIQLGAHGPRSLHVILVEG